MGTKHGETPKRKQNCSIREDVYERACNGYGRDRLTMTHELDYLLLHRAETRLRLREKMELLHHIKILSGKRMWHLQVN